MNTINTSPLRFSQPYCYLSVFSVVTLFLSSLPGFGFSSGVNAGQDLRNLKFEPIALVFTPETLPGEASTSETMSNGSPALDSFNLDFMPGTASGDSRQNVKTNDRYNPEENPVTDFSQFLIDPYANSDMDLDYSTLIARQLVEMESHINSEGPYGQSLQKDLNNLAQLYQDAGEFAEAGKTLERVLQISKINKGLFHEEQIPIAEAYIKTLIALGDYTRVDEQLDFLVYLYQKCFGADSPEIIKPLANKVAWDMHLYKLSAYENKASVYGNALVSSFSSSSPFQSHEYGILAQTQETIVKAIQILINARDFSNPFLVDFEQQLIATYFYQARANGMVNQSQHLVSNLQGTYVSIDPYDFTMANFLNGEQAYQRLLGYMEKSGWASSFAYVQAAIGLGDWYTLFGKRQRGIEQYQQAQAILDAGNFTAQEKQTLLNPQTPSPLPAFNDASFVAESEMVSGDMTQAYMGYIDVAFEVGRLGLVKNFETLTSSPHTPRNVISTLEWEIRDTQYRPLLVNESGPESKQFHLRYYYNY